MAVPDDQIYPDNQLLDRAVPTIARLEASLADEHEATRLALNSANLLETLTNLSGVIADERGRMDALEFIVAGGWSAEEFHFWVISCLLDSAAHHGQAWLFIAALLDATSVPSRLLTADWNTARVHREVRHEKYPEGSAQPRLLRHLASRWIPG